MDQSREKAGSDKLVLVVHGVGDPARGWTVETLARQLSADSSVTVGDEEFPWGEGSVTTRVCRTSVGQKRVVFAEVFWGDLSHVGHNILGILRGFFDVLLHLRHVAEQATAGVGRAGRWLGQLCFLVAWLLHGPVAALNLLLAGFAMLGAAMLAAGKDLDANAPHAVLVYGTTIFVCFGMVAFASYRLRALTACLAFCGASLVAVSLAAPSLATSGWYSAWDHRVFAVLLAEPYRIGSFAWYGAVMVLVLTLVWLALVVTLLSAFLVWLAARFCYRGGWRRALDLAYVVTALAVGIWGLVIPALWIGVAQLLPLSDAMRGYFFNLFEAAVPFMGLQWVMALVFGGAAIITLRKWLTWSRTYTAATYDPNCPAPRLLVAAGLQGTLIVTSVLGMLAVVGLASANGFQASQPVSDDFRAQLESVRSASLSANRVLIPLTGFCVLALLVPWVRRRAQFGLDVALDVVNHFRRREGTRTFYPREEIRLRLRQVLDAVVQQEDPGEITIVAHSQGSIVAVNVLCEEAARLLARCGADRDKLALVTLGSPLTHLYQHYFPLLYPPITESRWDGLYSSVGKWINIYRINDFVGTYLEARDMPEGPKPANFYVGPRGHTFYWNDNGPQPPDPDDAGVIAILRREVPL